MPSNPRVRDTHLPHIRLFLLVFLAICFTLFAGAMVIHEETNVCEANCKKNEKKH